ncbi:hypothetical protein [Hornefia butyriciproducens]|uniref:hypothetical protein n=1 Tax=Hornefia butyriciproducens TaxID=2652293 RepID=UPI002A91C9B9|nr:hypothetical protein [Hornefia butyriciproducens]MDY5423856.1 hypothetical protein [Hornefia butyriciproducens]
MNAKKENTDALNRKVLTGIRDEILDGLYAEFGERPAEMTHQRRIAAAKYVFDRRQVGIRSGIVAIDFAMRDLRLPSEDAQAYKNIFRLCQYFVFRDGDLRQQVLDFSQTPDAARIPKSMDWILKNLDSFCESV